MAVPVIDASPPPSGEQPDWPRLSGQDALDRVGSRPEGLTTAEAVERLRRCGPNQLPAAADRHLLRQFARQFTHLMAILLWAGAGIALAIGLPQLAVAIVAVIAINGAFSFWQEYRADRAMQALRRLLPNAATVLRNGEPRQVSAAEVVPGDLVLLSEGDNVPADGRLLEAHNFATNDAALTGESAAVPRGEEPLSNGCASPAEAPNCVFAGTSVATGRGVAVVTATGAETVFGRIARLAGRVRERPSPLQRELGIAVRAVTGVAVAVGLIFSLPALFLVRLDAAAALTFSLGLIVAFVPEGMLPTLTLSLAMAVQRMARRRAVVRYLPAVEALGAASVIGTDKTGVLTQNRMAAVAVWAEGREYRVTGSGYAPRGEFYLDDRPLSAEELVPMAPLIRVAALCNYARLRPPVQSGEPWEISGDPTEGALQALAARAGIHVEELLARRRLAAEWPFDARRQRMTVAYPLPSGLVALTKGSAVAVLERCRWVRRSGEAEPLTRADRDRIRAAEGRFTAVGLRVLALAERPLSSEELDLPEDAIERDLVFLGLVALHDPPRPEVPEAVRRCQEAGIRIIIISGDHGHTVAAIGRQVGIVRTEAPRIVEGCELAALDDAALRAVLATDGDLVFARIPPDGKLRVVEALQALGHVVAVTGDGVNDAPALRQADVGVAMGRSGTDVARAAADIVLADDNFASIVAAIEEGRAVFDNIRKFTTYIFTSNAAEAVPFIVFLLSAGRIPLALPIMLVLAVDLGTDMFPGLALGAESAEPEAMRRPPRERRAHLISAPVLLRSLAWLGLLEGAAGMAAFFATYASGGHDLLRARAAAFAGIVAAQVANVLVCRGDRGFAFARPWNRLLGPSIALELAILSAVIYLPAFQSVFGTASMTARDWLAPLLALPAFFAAEEVRKLVASHLSSRPTAAPRRGASRELRGA